MPLAVGPEKNTWSSSKARFLSLTLSPTTPRKEVETRQNPNTPQILAADKNARAEVFEESGVQDAKEVGGDRIHKVETSGILPENAKAEVRLHQKVSLSPCRYFNQAKAIRVRSGLSHRDANKSCTVKENITYCMMASDLTARTRAVDAILRRRLEELRMLRMSLSNTSHHHPRPLEWSVARCSRVEFMKWLFERLEMATVGLLMCSRQLGFPYI